MAVGPSGSEPEGRGQVYIPDPIIRLGRMKFNDTASGSFFVVNGSNQTVTLDQLVKSCGCTTAELGARELPAGGRAEVKFSIQSGTTRGPRSESIGVTFSTGAGRVLGPIIAKILFTPTGI
ncbi:DUF1573 domain-containing protein, partial [Gemmata sp. JC717]|uniref:DUF1573 domain-containing protein n=1 Tax=Gemmata algarum TaxID=2975278 RepID=UPI0021BB688D